MSFLVALLVGSPMLQFGGDQFGAQLLAIGDLTGDGISEVLISDPTYSARREPDYGAVWLYDPVADLALHVWRGESAQDGFGTGLALAPDIDGDGTNEFAAWGSRKREGAQLAWRLIDPRSKEVLHAGRRSNDLLNDSIVVVPHSPALEPAEPTLLVAQLDRKQRRVDVTMSALSPPDAAFSVATLTEWSGSRAAHVLGDVVASDRFDRDRWSALVVGSDDTDRVWCLLPSRDTWSARSVDLVCAGQPSVRVDLGAEACKKACIAFRALGGFDLDRDEIRDWILTNPGVDAFDSRVVAISGNDGKILWRTASTAISANARSLCWIDDEDGDGIKDFVIGSPGTIDVDQRPCVMSGASGKLLRTIAWVNGIESVTYFGSALAAIGDVDDDGVEDLLVAAISAGGWTHNPGVVRLMSGASGKIIQMVHRPTVVESEKPR